MVLDADDSCRVIFFGGMQHKLLELARKTALQDFPNRPWYKIVAGVIGMSPRMVYYFRSGRGAFTVAQVKALATFIPMELNELQGQIKDIRKEYWWCSKAGKACFGKYGRAYFYELGRKGGAKVGKMQFEKYGPEYFRRMGKLGGKLGYNALLQKHANMIPIWRRKAAILGGEKSAEKQPLTKQQDNLVGHNTSLGLAQGFDFKVNYTIKSDGTSYNFDMAYFQNSTLIAVEETTEVAPSRACVFSRVLDAIERKEWLRKNGWEIATLSTFRKIKNVRREFKFPPDAVLVLIEEGVIPIFDDDMVGRSEVIKCIHKGESPTKYLHNLRRQIIGDISLRQKFMERLAKGEKSRPMNQTELLIHEKLNHLGLSPKGKIILKSIYETFMVPDNCFTIDDEKWFAFVSTTTATSLRNHIARHAGYAFMLKRIFDPAAKCLTVTLGGGNPLEKLADNKWVRYLSKFSDLIIGNQNLNALDKLCKG